MQDKRGNIEVTIEMTTENSAPVHPRVMVFASWLSDKWAKSKAFVVSPTLKRFVAIILATAILVLIGYTIGQTEAFNQQDKIADKVNDVLERFKMVEKVNDVLERSLERRSRCEDGMMELFGLPAGSKLWFLHRQQGQSGKVYKVFSDKNSSFDEAQTLCTKHNMRLMTIESLDETNFLMDIFPMYKGTGNTAFFWTSGKCIGSDWYWEGDMNRQVNFALIDPLVRVYRLSGDSSHEKCSVATSDDDQRRDDGWTGAYYPACEAYLPKSC